MGYEMRYLANLIHEKDIFTSTKETVHVLELEKTIDPIVFDEWANHFRRCYCDDAIIDRLIKGTKYGSKEEYLLEKRFPSEKTSLGSATRTGDFSELLVSDYLEYVFNYIIPKDRYRHKFNPDTSSQGNDVIGFKLVDDKCTINDEMVLFEVKGKKQAPLTDNRLQKAIDDTYKDYLNEAEILDTLKQRAIERGDDNTENLVARFQDKVRKPYSTKYGAAAVLEKAIYDDGMITAVNGKKPVEWLIVIKRENLKLLIDELYERAAKLA